MLVPSSSRRRFAVGVWAAGGMCALAACSSSSPEQGFTDAGAGGGGAVDARSLVDTSAPPSFSPDGGGHDATVGSDDSSTGAGDDGSNASDASWQFDGFAHADGFSEAAYCPDDDGDGFTACGGDCNDHDSLVNPCAFDTSAASGDAVGTDGIDNDCDGAVDNRRVCDTGLTGHDTTPLHYAQAMDLCPNPACPNSVTAAFKTVSDATAARITAHMGSNPNFHPHAGSEMVFLSSGVADDDLDTPSYRTGGGKDWGKGGTNPDPLPAAKNPNACSATGADESTVSANDMVELDLTLKAPVNAGSFTFDFNFFSEEYPHYVCAGFNDTFLAELTSIQYPTTAYPSGFQIAFDSQGHRVNVNNGFFVDCPSVTTATEAYNHTCTGALSLLNGTGYEIKYGGNDNLGSGATDWLKTTAPIQPGETFTLRFYVFDEQDGILDSAIILDNFRWSSTTLPNPVTGR